jgi:hypothetical protein
MNECNYSDTEGAYARVHRPSGVTSKLRTSSVLKRLVVIKAKVFEGVSDRGFPINDKIQELPALEVYKVSFFL